MDQLTGLGFLHIKNVDGFDEEGMFESCKKFFSISE